jgi:hypothetical protein
VENVNLCHFSSCDLLHKNGSVNVPFPNVHVVEMIDSLTENFKMGFSDLHSHATNRLIFEKLFPVEVSDTPEKLQLELSELQYDSILHSSVNKETVIGFLYFFTSNLVL